MKGFPAPGEEKKMTVGFLGAIRQITGVREQKLAATTVEALLASLLDLYGDSWKERVFDGAASIRL